MKRLMTAALALIIGLSACDLLDTVPKSSLAPENYFRTRTDLQLFSNTFYNNLLDKTPYEQQSDYQIHLNLSSLMHGGNYRVVPASGNGWTWTDLRKLNTMLGHIDNCDDEEAVKEYTGLCKFFRAYIYADKVRRFGDVPWVDVELGSADEALYNPRDSRDVVLSHMIEDIDDAIASLPSKVSTYRVNKWAALALKAQFCLFEGTWRKYHANDVYKVAGKEYSYFLDLAADAAKQIIDGGVYKLAPDYLTLFAEVDADKDEYILAIKNDFSLAIFNNCNAYAIMPTQGTPGLTKKFIDTYLMKDGSRFTDREGWESMEFKEEVADRDPRLAFTVRTPGYKRIGSNELASIDLSCTNTGFQLAKWVQDCTLEGVDRVDRATNDMPVYRYGEVLLMYAEALAENGKLTQAALDESVNLLRDRVGMPHMVLSGLTVDPYLISPEYGYQNPILLADPHLAEILEVRRERGVELAVEGKRWYDLMRWAEGKCIEQPLQGMWFPGPGEYDLDGDGVNEVCLYTGSKPKTNARFVLQIGSESGIILSEGTYGYVDRQQGIQHVFDPGRDYLYPIPINERSLNKNLAQNPGWDDGLDF